jgi:hypothetical protein
MPKREARKQRFEEEARRIREQAEHQVTVSVWDRDPIKQYVRRFGWLQVIKDYVERRRKDGVDRPLKYLTIPGPNASDIGLLWRSGLLARTTNGFPYVAICDKEYADTVLKNLGALLGVSRRWFYQGVRNELASLFPFDVINLDLCGAVITGHPKRHKALRRLVGIRRIFQLQRGQGFLLLLTTSTDDESARPILEGVLLRNFDEDRFKEACLSRYGTLDLSPFQEDYRTFVRLVLPKAIGRMARDRGYRIVEHFVAKYNRPTHNLICHSFELEPIGGRDPTKKYEPRFKEIVWDELTEELSNRARRQATNAYEDFLPTLLQRDPRDVADVLRADPDLEAELRGEAESLIGWWESDESE